MSSPTPGQTNLGVAPNVGGLLCYVPCCIGLIFSIVAAIVEKQSRFLRFHAFQSLLFHAAAFALAIALQVLQIVLAIIHLGALGLLISLFHVLIGVGLLGISIFLMIKANGNEEFELPVIGEMAKKWA
jgi:uncharacterized membrane protein